MLLLDAVEASLVRGVLRRRTELADSGQEAAATQRRRGAAGRSRLVEPVVRSFVCMSVGRVLPLWPQKG